MVPDQRELAPRPKYSYIGFGDLSGGNQDSMTLAIADAEESRGWQTHRGAGPGAGGVAAVLPGRGAQ